MRSLLIVLAVFAISACSLYDGTSGTLKNIAPDAPIVTHPDGCNPPPDAPCSCGSGNWYPDAGNDAGTYGYPDAGINGPSAAPMQGGCGCWYPDAGPWIPPADGGEYTPDAFQQ
jgi:hypothetical protein